MYVNSIEHGEIYRKLKEEFNKKLLEVYRDYNLNYCVTQKEFTDSYTVDYNIVYTSKAQKPIDKPKKKKIKLKIINSPITKPNTVTKKLVIYKSPDSFKTIYQYFAYMAGRFNLDYVKYQSSCDWVGPAIIIINTPKKLASLRSKIKIPLSIDILSNDRIAIFPKDTSSINSISYKENYNVEERNYNIEVIEWIHNDTIYHLDKISNNVYDPQSDYFIGRRVFNFNTNTWIINTNAIEDIIN